MTMWLIVFCCVFLLVALVALKAGGASVNSDGIGRYKAAALMSENEREFFGRLLAACPDHFVFPQVAMGALIAPASSDKKIAHADRLRVAQQRVDFVICDKACKVVVVIELDDRTHQASKDQRRDDRLQQGGIRTVRFQSKNRPDAAAIRDAVLGGAVVAGSPTTQLAATV